MHTSEYSVDSTQPHLYPSLSEYLFYSLSVHFLSFFQPAYPDFPLPRLSGHRTAWPPVYLSVFCLPSNLSHLPVPTPSFLSGWLSVSLTACSPACMCMFCLESSLPVPYPAHLFSCLSVTKQSTLLL